MYSTARPTRIGSLLDHRDLSDTVLYRDIATLLLCTSPQLEFSVFSQCHCWGCVNAGKEMQLFSNVFSVICVHVVYVCPNCVPSSQIRANMHITWSWSCSGSECISALRFTDKRFVQCPHLTVTMLSMLFPGTLTCNHGTRMYISATETERVEQQINPSTQRERACRGHHQKDWREIHTSR